MQHPYKTEKFISMKHKVFVKCEQSPVKTTHVEELKSPNNLVSVCECLLICPLLLVFIPSQSSVIFCLGWFFFLKKLLEYFFNIDYLA